MKIDSRLSVLALTAVGVCSAVSAAVTVPEVSNVRLAQAEGSRKVTIKYDLVNAPAIVTFDIQTNTAADASGEWKSIGGENIDFVTGAANRVVQTDGTDLEINWRADRSWPNHVIPDGCARAVVTAWATNDAPNYMVVSLSKANPEINFYADASFVPGGVTNNPAYKSSRMVFRRINARGVKWQMGTVVNTEGGRQSDETTHDVTLDHDYYLAVFPLTQAQWTQVKENNPSWHWAINGDAGRPADIVGVRDARGTVANNAAVAADSFMGVLGARTGLKFDLPLESEWEFACRAGWGSGYWPNGRKMLKQDVDAGFPGRYKFNGGYINGTTAPDPATADVDAATPVVGTNGANDWGLYDMLGCLFEFCRDFYQADITTLNGALCTSGTRFVRRGGSFTVTAQSWGRPGARQSDSPYNYTDSYHGNGYNGFRVACYSFAH